MVFLERFKVHLTCDLDRRTLRPGGSVSGTVRLQVKEVVTFSSLRLHVTGTELLEVMVQEGTSTMVLKDELPYLNHCITITGPDHSSGDRTRQRYEVGAYIFPFTVTLPVNCPPSFAVCTQSGRATMRYAVKAVLEIPSGFDATSEQSFHVLSLAPESQYQRVCCGGRQEDRVADVYKRAFLCCLCGKKEGCQVSVTAKVAPGIFCAGTPPDGTEPITAENEVPATVPSASLTIYLCVDNTLNDVELTGVKVQLRNVCTIMHDRHESMFSTTVASVSISDSFAPGETHEMVVELRVPVDRLRCRQKESYELPLPTLTTSTVRSTYFLDVVFPNNAIGTGLKYVGLVNVVHEISPVRGLHDAPGLFQMLPSSRPTDVRYVAAPARVQFPADVEALYACEHHAYLPYDAQDPAAERDQHVVVSGADESDIEDGSAGGFRAMAKENERKRAQENKTQTNQHVDEGAVDAVVVRGSVVQGVMQGFDYSEAEL